MANEEMTIKQARDIMRQDLRKGTTCLCCSQPVKMYSRSITSSMAYGLILLYMETIKRLTAEKSRWIHLEDFFKSSGVPASIRGDIPKLRFFDLIYVNGDHKQDGNPNNGEYALTVKGTKFVEGDYKCISHVQIYNNKFYGYPPDAKEITIKQALKNKFNYEKLME